MNDPKIIQIPEQKFSDSKSTEPLLIQMALEIYDLEQRVEALEKENTCLSLLGWRGVADDSK